MFCPKCGANINDTARFCLICGEKINQQQNTYDNSVQSIPVNNAYKKEPLNAKKLALKIIAILLAAFPLVRGFVMAGNDMMGMGIFNILFSLFIIGVLIVSFVTQAMDDDSAGILISFLIVVAIIVNSIGIEFTCNENIFYFLIFGCVGGNKLMGGK